MYEHHTQPILSHPAFLCRMLKHIGTILPVIVLSLGSGVLGYHFIEGMSWIDALLNASMIAGGMGPVNPLTTTAGKIFASFYALYSGLFLIAITGYLIAPIFHRLIHKFHQKPYPDL